MRRGGAAGGGVAAPVGAGRARRRGSRASHPPGRSFLPMTTWHLMHFFILRAHSAGGGERGWAGPRGLGHTPPPHTHTHPHSPSHTVRCWHGENSTSSASSEHTRHSAASGPDGAATCRFVTVLGVPSTSLGPGAAPPLPPACRSLRLEEGLERAPGLPGPRPPPRPRRAHRKRCAQPCRALSTRPSAARSSGLRPRWLA